MSFLTFYQAKNAVEHLTEVLWEALELVDETGLVVSKYILDFNDFTKSQCGAITTIAQLRDSFDLPAIQDLGVSLTSGFFA